MSVQVKVYCHEGEGNEQLDSMDLHDVKSELEKDAEKAEVRERTCNTNLAQYHMTHVYKNSWY